MTPQEKARELIDKFEDDLMECDTYFLEAAKKRCALIAVDLRLDGDFIYCGIEYGEDSLEYWEQVKIEIEKL
jgi:hypothetical protein